MKTTLRILVLSAGVFAVALCLGSREDEAKADVPQSTPPVALELAAAPAENEAQVSKPAETKSAEVVLAGASTNSPAGTNAAALTNVAGGKLTANVIMGPTVPETLNLSKPMSDVVKLIQAGVSEQVLLAYIASAADPFDAGSNEIIYLNDLGVPSDVITALLQHDSTPEMQTRKQVLNSAKPLPPGVALTTPATNIYTPKENMQNPPEPQPVNPPAGNSAANSPVGAVSTVTTAAPVYTTDEMTATYDPGYAPDGYDTGTTINYNYWYSNLAPYGSWVDVGGYGPCWRPTVAVCNSSWRPYGDCGRWLWSNSGWYWYSDYSWGWGPFHYGRWACPPGVGWVWTPGNTWGPAWVSWRSAPSYCGWAPLPPAACYTPSSGFYFNNVSVGFGCDFGLAASAYVFVPLNRFCDRRPYNYYVSGGHGNVVYKDSTVANHYAVGRNTVVNNGIGMDRVAQVTRGDIRRVTLKDTTSLRDLGPRREQLAADGATLAVHRPDAPTISRIGAIAPSPKPVLARPGGTRPGAANVGREPTSFARPNTAIDQARLTSPANPAPALTRPVSPLTSRHGTVSPNGAISGSAAGSQDVVSHPQPGQSISPAQAGNARGSDVTGGAGRSGQGSIVMRNPNPNRNNANRPITYPYAPATQSPATSTPRLGSGRSITITTPANPNSAAAPRSSFVPGPPAASPRSAYNTPAANNYAPSPGYQARPSYTAPASPSPRVESSRPAVSTPAPSQSSGGNYSSGRSGGGESSSRGSDSGSVSRGGSVQVGRGR